MHFLEAESVRGLGEAVAAAPVGARPDEDGTLCLPKPRGQTGIVEARVAGAGIR